MDLAGLVESYGYLAVALGTLLEGESVLLLAGFAARRGYLDMTTVVLVALAGGALGDQLFFTLGRLGGPPLLTRFPPLQAAQVRVSPHIRRHQNLLVVFVRFMYGLRIAGPIVIGISGVDWRRFLVLNLLGAAIWAALIAGLGYLFGEIMGRVLNNVHHWEAVIFLGVLGVAALWGLYLHLRRRR